MDVEIIQKDDKCFTEKFYTKYYTNQPIQPQIETSLKILLDE